MTLETDTDIGAAEPAPPDTGPPRHDNLWRPWWAHTGIWLLLALAGLIITGMVVLSSSAGAAGGCGGG